MTPPAVAVALPGGSIRRGDAPGRWAARLIPNLYPAARPDGEPRGVHEVVVESPRHAAHPYEDPDSFVEGFILAVWRLGELWREGWPRLLAWFKNAGKAGGASIEHVHSQILALSSEPPCRPERPRPSESLLAATLGPAALYAHPEPQANHHLVAAPKAPREAPWAEDRRVLESVARLVAEASRVLAECLGYEGYNAWMLATPSPEGWWVEIAPARPLGGLERGLGVYLVEVPPEEAAGDASRCLRL
jgi:UDPglucose--hexose-1-phosphate uridylyltransferase